MIKPSKRPKRHKKIRIEIDQRAKKTTTDSASTNNCNAERRKGRQTLGGGIRVPQEASLNEAQRTRPSLLICSEKIVKNEGQRLTKNKRGLVLFLQRGTELNSGHGTRTKTIILICIKCLLFRKGVDGGEK